MASMAIDLLNVETMASMAKELDVETMAGMAKELDVGTARHADEVIAMCFGLDSAAETGRNTEGHRCVTANEQAAAQSKQSGLLTYGEVLPAGVAKLLGPSHLRAASASHLVDLGMGTGKLVMQAFLEYPNLEALLGVELASSRYAIAEVALSRFAETTPPAGRRYFVDTKVSEPGVRIVVVEEATGEPEAAAVEECSGAAVEEVRGAAMLRPRLRRRTIEFRCGDLFDCTDDELAVAQVVVLETCFPAACFGPLASLLLGRTVHPECRVVLYHDLRSLWAALPPTAPNDTDGTAKVTAGCDCPFHQLEVNKPESDTLSTSWSPELGYHFYCYERDDSKPPSLGFLPTSMVAHITAMDEHRQAMADAWRSRSEAAAAAATTTAKSKTSGEGGDFTDARAALAWAKGLGGIGLSPAQSEEPLPPGSEVEFAETLLPTDMLEIEEGSWEGDWSPAWVLARLGHGHGEAAGASTHDDDHREYRVVVVREGVDGDEAEVEIEEAPEVCLRRREIISASRGGGCGLDG